MFCSSAVSLTDGTMFTELSYSLLVDKVLDVNLALGLSTFQHDQASALFARTDELYNRSGQVGSVLQAHACFQV